jgi:hypothetical protein
MKSVTDYLTPDSFDYGKTESVMDQLIALPIPGEEKADMLKTWARAVGVKVNSSQVNKVRVSGTDQ